MVESVVVECESHFDKHGGPRNHDLVAHARLPDGRRVVVCVEAKAGEDLGETVEQYRKAAQAKRDKGETTNAPERLRDLLAKYVSHLDRDAEQVRLMRYQLLSALAGTEVEAAAAGADHAVLMIHEFLTDQRPKDGTPQAHGRPVPLLRDRARLRAARRPHATLVFRASAPESMAANLYIAWAVTDFRPATLEASTAAAS